ncbi:MAG: periplasmic mercury ion-binding protein [Phyllobacteriaceae bacterium]|uniref:periplasmic mercury ion-binding protein n=1 Tax=Nitratireductor alexandrii TaxID=2448161 RepID=UPI0008141AD0|nr:periplasmic mercury ion-binding protein [Nitratireductor alexandrii]MAW86278.1 periplasmic mercury ion-binding protein [Phyllobacteriaceae bacterium]MBA91287.1 periplasmic mercury ion-binding protein [Phyllobacteriaceae bacterium]
MKKYLVPAAICAWIVASPALAGEKRIDVNVGELTCPSCSYIAASSMKAVPSVEIVDFKQGSKWGEGVFTVTFDDQLADADMIVDAVKANGYPAEVLLASN